MYSPFIYVSIFFLLLFVPLLAIRSDNDRRIGRIRSTLGVATLISVFIALTPYNALRSSPTHKFGDSAISRFGCSYQMMQYAPLLDCHPDKGNDSCWCSNANAMATMAHCYETMNSKKNLVELFIELCETLYNKTVTKDEVLFYLDYYSRAAKPVDFHNNSQPLNAPVRLNDSITLLYKNSYEQFLGNYDRSMVYGGILVGYWIVVCLLAAVGNWLRIIAPRLVFGFTGPVSNCFRRWISLPATGNKRKTNEKPFLKMLDMLVPTRAETLILTGFIILSLYLTRKNIHYYDNDPIFQDKRRALLRYFAVRCSILGSNMMPLLILFGGRNNFLQWVTRWDYSTFITFHRWVSRIVFVMFFAHGLFYFLYMIDPIKQTTSKAYLLFGTASILAGAFIMVQGLLVLRRRWYEAFLVLHILLALIFVVGGYYHVETLYCTWFYYYAGVIWVFDRVIRLARIASFGFPRAEVRLIADECLKVVVSVPRDWEIIPGGHVFIHFLKPGWFWQSHPFTYTKSHSEPNTIIIFIKVKDGVTRSIYEHLKTQPFKTTYMRVAVEGSYGEKTPAGKYDSAVFFAGGNGIPGIFAEAYELSQQTFAERQSIKLIWVVREYKSLYWFYEELMELKNTNIETIIYVTRPRSNSCFEDFDLRFSSKESSFKNKYSAVRDEGTSDNLPTIDTIENTIKTELLHIEFREGRPLIGFLVGTYLREAQKSLCFVTCGHPVMVDDLRASVVKHIGVEKSKRIDYYEQLQVWA